MTDEMPVEESAVSAPLVETAPVAAPSKKRLDDKQFRVVAIVAAALLLPGVLVQVFLPLLMVPTFSRLYASMGGALPPATAAVVAVGPWLGIAFLLVDGLVFWAAYRLARRYWAGLLFAPVLTVGVLVGLFVLALYLPMFQAVSQIQ